ncbi:MAG: hypothetical protein ACI8TF_001467 [Paracoccaceae bacterium]|jgi:hypothetical protein
MSYAMSAALQAAVYGALQADVAFNTLVSGAVYDALPSGALPSLYVSLGTETVRDRSDKTGHGAQHDLVVVVHTTGAGFQAAKTVATALSDILDGADLPLSRGHLISLEFLKARARRNSGERQLEITFRALVDETIS